MIRPIFFYQISFYGFMDIGSNPRQNIFFYFKTVFVIVKTFYKIEIYSKLTLFNEQ